MVILGPIGTCPRALRNFKGLNEQGIELEVYEATLYNSKLIHPLVDKILRSFLLITKQYARYIEILLANNRLDDHNKCDMVICYDALLLPLVCEEFDSSKIIFDAREYYPSQFEDQFFWKFFFKPLNTWLLRKYLKSVWTTLTVSNGLANLYQDNFGISPIVLYSLPIKCKLKPKSTDSRHIKIVHHGNASPSRKLELMIMAMKYVAPNYSLTLYLVKKQEKYYQRLRFLASKFKNVQIKPPIKFEYLLNTLNQYDIGIFTPHPSNKNLIHSLPNKLFEYIQSRLCVITSSFPDMKEVVNMYEIGVTTKPIPEAIANCINKLSPKIIDKYKQNSHKAAEELSNERNTSKLLAIMNKQSQ